MLSAAVHRSSRDVSIMKEKLIFSGGQPRGQAEPGTGLGSPPPTCTRMWAHTVTHGRGHGTDMGPHTHTHTGTRSHVDVHTLHVRPSTADPGACCQPQGWWARPPGGRGRGNLLGRPCPFAWFIRDPHMDFTPVVASLLTPPV